MESEPVTSSERQRRQQGERRQCRAAWRQGEREHGIERELSPVGASGAIGRMLASELSGWRAPEVAWLLATCLIVAGVSLWQGEAPIGMVSAVTGIAYVVLAGKGKLSAYAFGTVNVITYSCVSMQAAYYGEVALNMLCYLPMMVVGFVVWRRNMDAGTGEVRKRALTLRMRLVLGAAVALATIAFGFVLRQMGDPLPFVDAFTTVASVAAMVLSVGRYAEQWALWIVIDAVSVGMWAVAFSSGVESLATLLMWVVYLANGVLMQVRWSREAASR